MRARTAASLTVLCLTAWLVASAHPPRARASSPHTNPAQSRVHSPASAHATARIFVHGSQAVPFDQAASPALAEIRISETFTGEMSGESTVRALQIRGADGVAAMVSLQRFRGKLGGREGTFVLQGSETVQGDKIKATWFVVPGSGTGCLSGLRGQGGFQGDFGKGSLGTLDYRFE